MLFQEELAQSQPLVFLETRKTELCATLIADKDFTELDPFAGKIALLVSQILEWIVLNLLPMEEAQDTGPSLLVTIPQVEDVKDGDYFTTRNAKKDITHSVAVFALQIANME